MIFCIHSLEVLYLQGIKTQNGAILTIQEYLLAVKHDLILHIEKAHSIQNDKYSLKRIF